MRYAAIILIFLVGCAAQNKMDFRTLSPEAKAQLKQELGIGDGNYFGGAPWVALVAGFGLFAMWSTWRHHKSSQDRNRLKGALTAKP